jgi:hypothetical protein
MECGTMMISQISGTKQLKEKNIDTMKQWQEEWLLYGRCAIDQPRLRRDCHRLHYHPFGECLLLESQEHHLEGDRGDEEACGASGIFHQEWCHSN